MEDPQERVTRLQAIVTIAGKMGHSGLPGSLELAYFHRHSSLPGSSSCLFSRPLDTWLWGLLDRLWPIWLLSELTSTQPLWDCISSPFHSYFSFKGITAAYKHVSSSLSNCKHYSLQRTVSSQSPDKHCMLRVLREPPSFRLGAVQRREVPTLFSPLLSRLLPLRPVSTVHQSTGSAEWPVPQMKWIIFY